MAQKKNGKDNTHGTLQSIDIRPYSLIDYPRLNELYETAGVFDPETDSEDRLLGKSEQNPDSLLIAIDEDGNLLGSISIIEDGRIAILFRLVAKESDSAHMVRMMLLHHAERILREYGYQEVHIMADESNKVIQHEYEHYGFTKGKTYRWYGKKVREES